MKFLAPLLLIPLTLTLSNCGGGSSTDDVTITVRPKSLDGLAIQLEGSTISLDFQRANTAANNSPTATQETGSITYRVNNNIQVYDSLGGQTLDAWWPNQVGQLSYTYTPTNASSGILSITSSSCTYIIPTTPTNRLPLDRLSRSGANVSSPTNIPYFSSGAPQVTNFILNFNSSGNVLDPISLTVEPASVASVTPVDRSNSPLAGPFTIDELTFRTTADIFFSNGGSVPTNYSPTFGNQNQRYSTIANASLNNRSVVLTPTLGASTSISFSTPNPTQDQQQDESGSSTLTNSSTNGGSYLYQNIVGSDSATLTFTGGAIDGVITLNFTSAEATNGSTIIQNAGGTYSIQGGAQDGESGTFEVRNS